MVDRAEILSLSSFSLVASAGRVSTRLSPHIVHESFDVIPELINVHFLQVQSLTDDEENAEGVVMAVLKAGKEDEVEDEIDPVVAE